MTADPSSHQPSEKLKLLFEATAAITKAMVTIPESQLRTAILRGFRTWPYRASQSAVFLEAVLQEIADRIRSVVGAEMAAIGIGRFPEHPFDPWVVSGVSEELRATLGIPHPRGILGTTAVRGQKIRVKDLRSFPDYKGLPPGHPEIGSFMAIPIRVEALNLGNLYVGNKIGEAEFSEEDECLAETLAQMAALAIQQTYLQSTLEGHQSEIHSLIDGVPSAVIFIDKLTGNITANSAAMDLFQRPMTEIVGEGKYRELLRSRDGDALSPSGHPAAKSLAGQTILGQELLVVQASGASVPVRLNSAPVHGIYGEIMGAVLVFENISLEKKIEQMRQQMTSMVVHDIRNPIQAILINAQTLRRTPSITPQIEKQSQLIEENATRVISLTRRLLEAARIESEHFQLKLDEVDLKDFVEKVISRLSVIYSGRRITVHGPEGIRIKIDEERLEAVLTNLVDNAARYSARDTPIELNINAVAGGIELSVRDHGPGIEPELLNHLFEPYKRGALGHAKASGGLGLGLFIVKGIVEAHGGTVNVESKAGEGTVFRLHIPSKNAA